MKLTTEIGNKAYVFELDRSIYKELLSDEKYAKIQTDLMKKNKGVKSEEDIDLDTSVLLNSLILNEKVFFYGLKKHQPNITELESSNLLDKMIEEDGGMEGVNEICTSLIQSFIKGTADKTSKKRVIRKG